MMRSDRLTVEMALLTQCSDRPVAGLRLQFLAVKVRVLKIQKNLR
jgi:hypothetical protein